MPRDQQRAKPIESQTRITCIATTNQMSNSRSKESKRAMQPREIKGLEIAAKLKLVRRGNTWYVPSQSNKQEKYTVALTDEKPQCTCRDYEFRNDKCKHIFAVEYTIEREQNADGQTVVTETVKVIRKTYPQNGRHTMQLKLTRNQNCRRCSMNFAGACLSLCNIWAGRVFRLLTLFSPPRSRFTRPCLDADL